MTSELILDLNNIEIILKCFICDQPADSNCVFINKTKTDKSGKEYHEMLKNVIGESCTITIFDSDVFCQTCKVLIEELDSLQCESQSVTEMLSRQVFRKYNIKDTSEIVLNVDVASAETFEYGINNFCCLKCDFTTSFQDAISPHYKLHEIQDRIERESENEIIAYSPEPIEFDEPIAEEIIEENKVSCSRCKKIFNSVKLLGVHLVECLTKSNNLSINRKTSEVSKDVDDLKKEYFCTICQTHFIAEDTFQEHVQNHCSNLIELSSLHKCRICFKNFNDFFDLLTHLKNHQNVGIYKCPFCSFKKVALEDLVLHIKNGHKNQNIPDLDVRLPSLQILYNCKFCGFQSEIDGECDHHNAMELGTESIECTKCGEHYYGQELFDEHITETHNQCKICLKTFKDRNSRINHEYRHKTTQIFQCKYCDKLFKTKIGLKYHLPQHTGDYKYNCSFCKKGFMNEKIMEEHMGTHTKELKYICDICGAKFSFNSSYRQHKIWHDNPYPSECKECGLKFKHPSVLAVHRRSVHSLERPYECKVCGKKFASSSRRNKHALIHQEKIKFTCEVCQKQFGQKYLLAKHLFKIHDDSSMINQKKCEYKIKVRPEYVVECTDGDIQSDFSEVCFINAEQDINNIELFETTDEIDNIILC